MPKIEKIRLKNDKPKINYANQIWRQSDSWKLVFDEALEDDDEKYDYTGDAITLYFKSS